ncbi:MAG: hypothetical protein V4655_02505 [Bdellovibrionota bacterium]|nr:MAG: hypothetical protein EOP10_19760 [Pseudomonadota bacterium]
MSASSQMQSNSKSQSKQKSFSPQTLTSGKNPKSLSPQILQAILEQVQLGDRNQARRFISQTLNVNDVVAECCLRHLEEKLSGEQDYRERILRQVTSLGAANITDHQQFLRDAFGVQGIVSKAILNHWRIAGA